MTRKCTSHLGFGLGYREAYFKHLRATSNVQMKRNAATKKIAVALTLVLAAAAMVYLFLKDMEPLGGIVAAVLILATLVVGKTTWRNPAGVALSTWGRPILIAMLMPSVLLTITCGARLVDMDLIAGKTTLPEDSEVWREDLPLKVYWSKRPSEELKAGFSDTVEVLGFNYENVDSVEDANITIWLDSWSRSCKWMKTAGFVSPDPNPSDQGAQTGEIHICQFTTPFKDHPLTDDYSTITHDTGHLLAAQPHFGTGLMAKGGGDGSPRLSKTEIKTMRHKIDTFHESVRPIRRLPPLPAQGNPPADDELP